MVATGTARWGSADLWLEVLTGGAGAPLVVLHHDIGNPGWLPFHDALAAAGRRVVVPTHPGFGASTRPDWARSVRDLATLYRQLLWQKGLAGAPLVGLGFGGWIAADLATTAPGLLRGLVLVNPMGLKPRVGEIYDQFLVSSEEYVRAGFGATAPYEATFGALPDEDQLVDWEVSREMVTRVAWKPYMFDRSLRHCLPGVTAPTLVVAGLGDRIVPEDCARQYAELIPDAGLATLPGGHLLEIEEPAALARLVLDHLVSRGI